ncbi:MAG TPA: serine/threonine-protein kinase [Ktedonobacteraceae bacterium]|nr:serine/threonine-protein kinase [Ktedonobacteraceae bacterium]
MSTNPARIDKYELQELLGKSGMAEVWKAIDTLSHQQVAIKLIHANLKADPDFLTRFRREVQAVVSLHHQNIIRYHDFSVLETRGIENIMGYIVMDYVDGGTLAGYLQSTSQQGKFPATADIIELFSSICAGVDYAHQRGIVPGSLKPSNILFPKYNTTTSSLPEPIVTDFCMLKLMGVPSGNGSGWFGLPVYSSPEQIMGNPAGPRGDIYSLGVILYELCTGTPPFPGNNPATIMMQHINAVPTLPSLINPALPPALTAIIMRCLAKDPGLRFPDVSSLMVELAGANVVPGVALHERGSRPDYPSGPVEMPTVIDHGSSSISGSNPLSYASYSPTEMATLRNEQMPAAAAYATPSAGTSTPPGGPLVTPTLNSSRPGGMAQSLPPVPYGSPPLQSPVVAPKKSGRRGLYVILSVLLILLILGGSLGAYLVFFKGSSGSTAATPGASIAGYATFVSSELLSSDLQSNQGITDQMLVRLNNLPPPAQGMNYYAWLLNRKSLPWNPIALGTLKVNNNSAILSYANAQHTNLLATNSRFLITEESATTPPLTPSLNSSSWRFYAEFADVKPVPSDPKSYSLYDHLRHLLSDDPKVAAAGMSGGLDTWLYRDSEKLLEWAGSARDAQKTAKNTASLGFLHRQLTRVMDFLDGTSFTQLAQDLPGQPVYADPTISKIGLLTFDTSKQDPLGYLYHIGTRHLHEMVLLPGINPDQKALAIRINQELNVVNAWYETMRMDILQLNQMTPAQLLGNEGRTLLNAVANLANTAFVGQINSQGQVTPGVVQIHYDIQRLATFDIRACTGNSPCPVV